MFLVVFLSVLGFYSAFPRFVRGFPGKNQKIQALLKIACFILKTSSV